MGGRRELRLTRYDGEPHGTRIKPVAHVTRASSRIGAATAVRLVKAGFTVFGTSRQANTESDHDSNLRTLRLDVTNGESVVQAVNRIMEETGRIDV
jgi:NADP-dependent 3-hydroxy acid dehydrogenase YdfG